MNAAEACITEDGFTELEKLEYETDLIIPELVLLTSLILRAPEHFVLPLSASAEYKSAIRREHNTWLEPLIPNLLRGRRELLYSPKILQNFLLPDVCCSCLTSQGLTLAGRLRTKCPECTEEEKVREYLSLQQEMGVFWVPHLLFESLVGQLLYKYYSHNGDRSWQIQIPQL